MESSRNGSLMSARPGEVFGIEIAGGRGVAPLLMLADALADELRRRDVGPVGLWHRELARG